MMTKRHKLLLTAISVIVLTCITVTSFAIIGGKKPQVTSGGFSDPIADRIAISVKNTEFTLKKDSSEAEEFTITFFLTAKKTQADFYAMLNSLKLEGIAYDSIVFTALNKDTEGKAADSLLLPSENGEAVALEWQVDVTLTVSGKGTYNPSLILDYTSGMTEAASQRKLLEIPLTVTVS